MRRFAFTLAASGLLLVFAPASALAHHHRHGHHSNARHTRVSKFGDLSGQPTTASSTSDIGTVQSFTGGVLTILLNDHSTVTGTVTNDTAIECSGSGQSQGSGEDQGDQSSGGADDQGDQSSGTDNQGDQSSGTEGQSGQVPTSSEDQGDQTSGAGDQGDQSSGSGDDDQNEDQSQSSTSCTPSQGTPVHAAELKLSGADKTWEKVELGS